MRDHLTTVVILVAVSFLTAIFVVSMLAIGAGLLFWLSWRAPVCQRASVGSRETSRREAACRYPQVLHRPSGLARQTAPQTSKESPARAVGAQPDHSW